MAAIKGQHVPGTPFHWEHGYHPLDEATAVKNKHKWRGAPGGGKRGTGVHRITNHSGQHQYVSGPAGDKLVERSATQGMTVEHHVTGHERELASAPKGVKDVWEAARAKGWSVSLYTPKFEGENRTIHDVQLVSPDGKVTHKLSWVDGKRTTYGNTVSTKKALDDINNYKPPSESPSKQMDDAIRSRTHRHDVTPPQSKEDRALAEARAKEAKAAEERRRQLANYEAAQARQRQYAQDRQAAEAKAREDAAKVAAQQKVRTEHADHLSSQAWKAYKAGDYAKALKLLDQAIATDPSRADTFRSRKDKVRAAKTRAA